MCSSRAAADLAKDGPKTVSELSQLHQAGSARCEMSNRFLLFKSMHHNHKNSTHAYKVHYIYACTLQWHSKMTLQQVGTCFSASCSLNNGISRTKCYFSCINCCLICIEVCFNELKPRVPMQDRLFSRPQSAASTWLALRAARPRRVVGTPGVSALNGSWACVSVCASSLGWHVVPRAWQECSQTAIGAN